MDTSSAGDSKSFYQKPGPVTGPETTGSAALPPPPPPPHQRIVLEQPGGYFGRFGKFVWMALLVSILANIGQRMAYESYFAPSVQVQEKYHSLAKSGDQKVAVIRVEGAILDADGFVKHQIDQVREDKDVKAVVLRIDSPGGTVTASDYLYHHLKQLREDREIPMVVSMGSLCASGGYYIAMAVGEQPNCVFAEPTSWTGSIGVIIPHYDVSELLEQWHIKDDSIASHRLKQLGSPTRKLNDEERAEERKILQTMVDDSFKSFKQVVLAGRPALRQDENTISAVSTGQIFTADQAVQNKLVDHIGFIEDAIDRAIVLAGLDKDQVRVVKYTQHVPGLLEAFSGTEARTASWTSLDLSRLMDLTAPRAYYLCTWLPAILTNSKP